MTALRVVDDFSDLPPIRLTPREQRVLELLAHGHERNEIMVELNFASHTVSNITRLVMSKLNAHTKAQMVYEAFRHGLLATGAVPEHQVRLIAAARRHIANLEAENECLRSRMTRATTVLLEDD